MKAKTTLSMLAILLMASSSIVLAGGPLIIFDAAARIPYAWPAGSVQVYTDLGNNGMLTGAESDALTANGFAEWTNVATSTFSAGIVGDFSAIGLPDINGGNAGLVVGAFNGGGIQVMYDDDGTITFNFFGAPPGVLGIASPEYAQTGTSILTEGWAMMNGTAVQPGDVGGATFGGVFTHEFGHAINLAHTQTNSQIGFFGDGAGPDACGVPFADPLTLSDFETMYPYLDTTPNSTGLYQKTVDHQDDISSISNIYPAAGWPTNYVTITGTVFAPDGTTEITGINVIARNVANPYKGAVSALSGDYTQGDIGPDGLFTLTGLTPGADYVLYIDEIVQGGFSTPPAAIPGDGNEEYWNAAESADPGVDAPCDYTYLSGAAGAVLNADVIVNGNPFNLGLEDDDFVEVALPFTFTFCDVDYNSVFVGSNGYITFGAGDDEYIESVTDLLGGPPRITGLWDDLNPTQGGSITAMPDGPNFVISYSNVPEYFATGANSFDITLRPDGSYDVDYVSLTATDGLAGRSQGGGAADPGPTDLSAAPQPIGALQPTVYEQFLANDNDLSGALLQYVPCDVPDPQAIAIDPTSMSATLLPGDNETQSLEISNTGELDLEFTILTNQDLGAPATGGVIPELDLFGNGDPAILDDVQLAKATDDRLAGDRGKPTLSQYRVHLPHTYALMLVTEDFNSGMPAGWTVVDNAGEGVVWQVPAQGGGNYTGATGNAAGASSDFVGPANFDTELRTPEITGFGTNVVLSYVVNYQNFAFIDYLDVDVSTDGGTNWTTVLSWNEDHGPLFGSPGEQVALNLDAFVQGHASFMVRWRYYYPAGAPEWLWYVHLDEVSIVSDEVLDPCDYLTVVPDAGTVPGGSSTSVDVTFDATGFAPGIYDCELIILSNAVNEPRLVVPMQMLVAQEVVFDIRPGQCPNVIGHDWNVDGGGSLGAAIVGSDAVNVGMIDISSLRLEGVAPRMSGTRDRFSPPETCHNNDNSSCTRQGTDYSGDCAQACALKDGHADIDLKFRTGDVLNAMGPIGSGELVFPTLTGFLNNGIPIRASDCLLVISGTDDNIVFEEETTQAVQTELGAAVPNPFNPMTQIHYSLATTAKVDLAIYDVKGRLVSRLVSDTESAGDHTVQWNANGLASGIYFYRMVAGQYVETRKLVLLK